MNQLNSMELKECGYTIIKDAIKPILLDSLESAIDISFDEHRYIQTKNGNEIKTDGVALHALLSSRVFIDLISELIKIGLIDQLKKEYFGANCILNSLSALSNIPGTPNFSSIVHRDLRFYSETVPVMLNLLIMVDEFTVDNGGTYLLPFSHLKKEKPTDEIFFKNAIQAIGSRGSILIFDSNVWHASAPNKTQNQRRAIPITISRSFMKQLLDYPRALGYENMDKFAPSLQQFLGYHSRVPASLNEWYQPENLRFYKKDQD
jgi:ectoine hydroxylase-related dioxygenase (phytanoyl-CoA dioxygenase family)